jgi:hypothetical protein
MATIKLADLEPGMVLTADAVLHDGRVLLHCGVTLTEKHIRTFKAWGLLEANVFGVSEEEMTVAATDGLDPQRLARAEAKVHAHFRRNDPAHPVVDELMRICVLRAASEPTRNGCDAPDG